MSWRRSSVICHTPIWFSCRGTRQRGISLMSLNSHLRLAEASEASCARCLRVLPRGLLGVLDVLSFLGGITSCRLSLNIVVLSASFLRHVLSSDPSFGGWQGSLLLPPSSEHCVALCSACHLHLVPLCPLSFSLRLFFFFPCSFWQKGPKTSIFSKRKAVNDPSEEMAGDHQVPKGEGAERTTIHKRNGIERNDVFL